MKNTIITMLVAGTVVAGLMTFAPLASAMQEWVGPTNDTPTGFYPTYGDDTPDPNRDFDDDVNADGMYPTFGDDARWSCTMDAMQCPDGSYIGRSGLNCQFACPGIAPQPDPNGPPYPTYGDDTPRQDPNGDQNQDQGPYPTYGDDTPDNNGCGENGMLCPNYIGDGSGWSGCGANGMLCPNYIGDGSANGYYDNTNGYMNGSAFFYPFVPNFFSFWNF